MKSGIKIAMSGTPVENRMAEYWSIFDFANKGYLGNLKNL
jgi:SNF2 family DNA or RNA helicase